MEQTERPDGSREADPESEPYTEADTGVPAEAEHWYDRHTHRTGSLILLAVSLCFIIAASQLEFGSLSRPGPALWPLTIAVITGALSLTSSVLPRHDEELFSGRGMLRVCSLFAAMLCFPLLFEYLGFVVPAALLILFMMRVLSKQSWLRSVIVAVVTTTVSYVLFGVLLNVRLPAFSLPF